MNITDFGVFVGVEDGIDGLVHISDMSWTHRVKHPSELFKKGDVDQIVIGYAKDGGRWHQHTWGMKDGKVVETTRGNFGVTEYYGLPLEGEEANKFAEWTAKNAPGQGKVRHMRPA